MISMDPIHKSLSVRSLPFRFRVSTISFSYWTRVGGPSLKPPQCNVDSTEFTTFGTFPMKQWTFDHLAGHAARLPSSAATGAACAPGCRGPGARRSRGPTLRRRGRAALCSRRLRGGRRISPGEGCGLDFIRFSNVFQLQWAWDPPGFLISGFSSKFP